jgi:hypothetical protein
VRVSVEATGHAEVEFDSVEELREVYERDLAAGGLRLETSVELPLFTEISVTLSVSGGGPLEVTGMVVNHFPGAVAVALNGDPPAILGALEAPTAEGPSEEEPDPAAARDPGLWARLRDLDRNEKLLLAPKASRAERTVLLKDNDAQVLYSLLKNPRISPEEVVRIARSHLLSSATADLIAKTAQWSSNAEIRIALVHNPRTPTLLALRLLPTLPEAEVRRIAKATAVSQAIRQAALKLVINRP